MRLREGFARWRELGVGRGTLAAVSVVSAPARRRWRAARLQRRPLRVGADELRAALGDADPRGLLLGPVRRALPTVEDFAHRLADDPNLREPLLEVAERVASHQFDLLGSGPTELGEVIDWQRDFKTGRVWPLEHISRLVVSYPDASDIKVPWELSRFQHLPVLAGAFRLTGQSRWVDEIGAQLEHWIESNPVEFGANWGCTMDVGIRAANWIATLALLGDRAPDEPWCEPVLASLLLHGRFIRTHLEWAPVRGNHYLSDVVGLLVVAALFGQGREGREWLQFAARELERELAHQVRSDGCDHEASIPYHRLVTELFVCGGQAARALLPDGLGSDYQNRIDSMLEFTRLYTRPDGLAPQVGDADDGRFLPLADYGRADPRSHLHLFDQARAPYAPAAGGAGGAFRHAAYPAGGYWIMRAEDLYVIVRCGDVGVGGQGSHAHNDALSFELAVGAQAVVLDPGSYLYTADLDARARFRSTAFHSTLQVDGAEQNPIDPLEPFAMADVRRAQARIWEPSEPLRPVFEGLHHGFERLAVPATHARRFELDVAERTLRISDTISSTAAHRLDWSFPLSPCEVTVRIGAASVRFPGGLCVEVRADGLEFRVEEGWLSPAYGRRERTSFLRATKTSRPPHDVTHIGLSVRA